METKNAEIKIPTELFDNVKIVARQMGMYTKGSPKPRRVLYIQSGRAYQAFRSDYIAEPGNLVLAMTRGKEIGVSPMLSDQRASGIEREFKRGLGVIE